MFQTDSVLNANRAPGMHLLQNPGPELSVTGRTTDDDDDGRTETQKNQCVCVRPTVTLIGSAPDLVTRNWVLPLQRRSSTPKTGRLRDDLRASD